MQIFAYFARQTNTFLEKNHMKKYYKIYHYSSNSDLDFIDPSFYGTGVTQGAECKRGKTGLEKSYFYIFDKPETCVASNSSRYEIYLPYTWKKLIYDRSVDPLELYQKVKTEITNQTHRCPYEYELKDGVEKLIKDLGYKGWTCSAHPQLAHVIMLFYPLSTKKPEKNYIVYDWSDKVLEKNLTPSDKATNKELFLFFQTPLTVNEQLKNLKLENLKLTTLRC